MQPCRAHSLVFQLSVALCRPAAAPAKEESGANGGADGAGQPALAALAACAQRQPGQPRQPVFRRGPRAAAAGALHALRGCARLRGCSPGWGTGAARTACLPEKRQALRVQCLIWRRAPSAHGLEPKLSTLLKGSAQAHRACRACGCAGAVRRKSRRRRSSCTHLASAGMKRRGGAKLVKLLQASRKVTPLLAALSRHVAACGPASAHERGGERQRAAAGRTGVLRVPPHPRLACLAHQRARRIIFYLCHQASCLKLTTLGFRASGCAVMCAVGRACAFSGRRS